MRDPAGNPAPPGGFQNLGWYSGYQYYNGSFGQKGSIHPQSPQVGAGQPVSQEVRGQSAQQQGVTLEELNAYLSGSLSPGTPGGGGGGGAGLGDIGGAGISNEFADVPFAFDWTAAEQEALEKLTPYYQEKLAEAQFDVDRAKRLIEEDYQRGVRIRQEDLTTAQREWAITEPNELEKLMTQLNQRGRLAGQITTPGESEAPLSGYAQQKVGELDEKQSLRRLAVERALQRQGEVADINRTRKTEEYDIEFPRYQKALEEEKKEKAVLQMAPLKYEQDYNKWLQTVGRHVNA